MNKKITFILLLVLLFSPVFTGCGSKKKEKKIVKKIVKKFEDYNFIKNKMNQYEVTALLLKNDEPWFIGTVKGLFVNVGDGNFKKVILPNRFSKKVTSIIQDNMGKIFVGTSDGLYESSNGKTFIKYDMGYINDLISDKDGNIICGTKNGLKFLSGKRIRTFNRKNSSLPHDTVTSLSKFETEDGREIILAGTIQGVVQIGENGNFTVYTGSKYVPLMNGGMSVQPGNTAMDGNTISKIVVISSNTFFIGTNKGLNKTIGFNSFKNFSANSQEPTSSPDGSIVYRNKAGNSPLLSNFIRAIDLSEDGKLVIGTKKGINIFDINSEKWETIKIGTYAFNGGKVNVIKCVKDGFYVGTSRGLSRFTVEVYEKEE